MMSRMERVNLRRLPDEWGAEEEALLQAVDDATATPIYIEYRLAPEWFGGIADVIDELEACVTQRPDVALVVVEHMIDRLDQAMVDDSDGGRVEAIEQLAPLHVAAASAARPDPVALAERLVDLVIQVDLEPFIHPAVSHGAVLGEAGLRALISAAEARRTGDFSDSILDRVIAEARSVLADRD